MNYFLLCSPLRVFIFLGKTYGTHEICIVGIWYVFTSPSKENYQQQLSYKDQDLPYASLFRKIKAGRVGIEIEEVSASEKEKTHGLFRNWHYSMYCKK